MPCGNLRVTFGLRFGEPYIEKKCNYYKKSLLYIDLSR